MSQTTIQDLLPLVQMPSRYLGCEANCIKKSWEGAYLHVALAFPDLYEIATSHFGIQILYAMLNAQDDILAERVFAPAADMEAQLRKNAVRLSSLESETPLGKFDIIGFSLLYELNYTNVINMLDLGGIALHADQRSVEDPFVIAGGPCTCNPEPVALFFDAIVVGDGEAVILQLTDAWKTWRQSGNRKRDTLLRRWAKIKGVYIPALFEVSYNAAGSQRLIPKSVEHRSVKRTVVSDLNDAPFPLKPIVPFGKPVHDRLRMEIARGCTRGCRFCQAGMIYRPVRERTPSAVLSSVSQSLHATGYEDISLLSLSTGDYSCIAPLMKRIMEFGRQDRVAVSLPSLRAGSLSPELMELIRTVRKTGFTIAPEAGSQRLRDVINKNITEADIFETVENAFSLGWKVIKLYFMIGLPTETQADIEAIVSLVEKLKTIAVRKGKNGRITVSVATFVPKPHTPFQWEPQIGYEAALEKINWLKDRLKLPSVQVKWQDPKVSMVEGVWARGDRRLNEVLLNAWKNGCRFDGWTDFFNFDRWVAVFKQTGINPEVYLRGYSDTNAPLPWDHIDIGVERSFLVKERDKALAAKLTADCRNGCCSGCGVCDFESLKPITFKERNDLLPAHAPVGEGVAPDENLKYVLNFAKTGNARFLGHLEMTKIFTRSLRRAKIPLKYSMGFHPMPKVSFGDTLPMGMESENEQILVTLTQAIDSVEVVSLLSKLLPSGLTISRCSPYIKPVSQGQPALNCYRVELKDGYFQQKDLDWFLGQHYVNIERKNKKGKTVTIDLKKAVSRIQLVDCNVASMTLGADKYLSVRPAQILKTVFHLSDLQILTAKISKQKNDDV
ncbi:TIGR03960 family B12-binding radical SAM protein [Desulfosarcina sp.]|uniref:TIGR03960 family B12-binding radical SAM protein n=1 Tax=Desulfosarcina sp. TaxID=2027861 RepID=UPI00397098CA